MTISSVATRCYSIKHNPQRAACKRGNKMSLNHLKSHITKLSFLTQFCQGGRLTTVTVCNSSPGRSREMCEASSWCHTAGGLFAVCRCRSRAMGGDVSRCLSWQRLLFGVSAPLLAGWHSGFSYSPEGQRCSCYFLFFLRCWIEPQQRSFIVGHWQSLQCFIFTECFIYLWLISHLNLTQVMSDTWMLEGLMIVWVSTE